MSDSKYTFIDEKDRAVLNEGKNYGVGFSFCKKIDNTTFVNCYPQSCCKDYLSDCVFSEITGKPYSAHGLHSSKQNLFVDGNAYLAMSILKRGARNPVEYENYKRDCDALNTNYENIVKLLNWFEKKLKLKIKTKIIKIKDNLFILVVPLFWVGGTYLISLYSLLARMSIFYKSGDPMEYLNNFNYDASECYLIKPCIPKINLMFNGIIPEQDFNANISWHNCGIIGYQFPTSATPAPKKETVIHEGLTQVWKPMKFA